MGVGGVLGLRNPGRRTGSTIYNTNHFRLRLVNNLYILKKD